MMFGCKNKKLIIDKTGYFGKLPCCADFIKHNVNDSVVADFDYWCQQSFAEFLSGCNSSAICLFKGMSKQSYIYFDSECTTPLIGALVSSCDRSERHYPFTMFRVVSDLVVQEFSYAIPLVYQGYFARLKAIDGRNLSEITADAHDALRFPGALLRRDILESIVVGLKRVSIDDYWRAVVDTNQLSHGKFVTAINRVIVLVESLDDSKSFVLKLPVCVPKYGGLLVTFWLHLFHSLSLRIRLSHVAWSNREMTVFFGECDLRLFSDLLGVDANSNRSVDLLQLADVLNDVDDVNQDMSLSLLEFCSFLRRNI